MNDLRSVMSDSFLALVMILTSAASALAQGPGVRAGVSVNPDQFYVGGHYETDELIDNVFLRPNLEVGVGDDVTTVSVNIEAIYKFALKNRHDTYFYAGGGPSINVYDTDGGSDTKGGLNLLAGLEFGKFFLEVKAGTFDSPDMKVGIGYTFRR